MDFSTATRAECAAFVWSSIYVNRRTRIIWMTFILFSFISFQSFAQSDWTLLKSESGVEVFYKITECEEPLDPTVIPAPAFGHQHLELKIVNQNASSVDVDFHKDIKLSGNDSPHTVTVAAGETLVSGCEAAPHVQLTETEGDDRPAAITDYLEAFDLTIRL